MSASTTQGGHKNTTIQQLLRWATVWPQQTWAEKWGLLCRFPWGRELGPHLTQCGLAEAYLPTK